jgi:uncharacterized membrane protein
MANEIYTSGLFVIIYVYTGDLRVGHYIKVGAASNWF